MVRSYRPHIFGISPLEVRFQGDHGLTPLDRRRRSPPSSLKITNFVHSGHPSVGLTGGGVRVILCEAFEYLDSPYLSYTPLAGGEMSWHNEKRKVLFICTHNSARSQMAEGLLNFLYGDRYEAHSAGTNPSGVSPYAIKVMAEIGVDISKHRSKSIEEFRGIEFDYVVTVCDHAKETCPFFPGGKRYLHKGFKDPSETKSDENRILGEFRKVRDEIKEWIEKTFSEKHE